MCRFITKVGTSSYLRNLFVQKLRCHAQESNPCSERPNLKILRLLAILGVVLMTIGNAQASVLEAAEGGDLRALQQALEAGEPIEERNGEGQTALLVAVWKDNVEMARMLIEAGADVNAKDRIEDSPFLVAGAHGRIDILRLTLANGADLASTNRFGGTALIPAAEKGHPEAVDILIAAGVDVDHVNNLGWTALLEAVILTDGGPVAQRIVRSLLDGGADAGISDNEGRTALEHARARGFEEIAAMLDRE